MDDDLKLYTLEEQEWNTMTHLSNLLMVRENYAVVDACFFSLLLINRHVGFRDSNSSHYKRKISNNGRGRACIQLSTRQT